MGGWVSVSEKNHVPIEVECIYVNENEMHEDVLIAECNINVGQNKE